MQTMKQPKRVVLKYTTKYNESSLLFFGQKQCQSFEILHE